MEKSRVLFIGEIELFSRFLRLWESGIHIYIKPEDEKNSVFTVYDFNKSAVLSEAFVCSAAVNSISLMRVLKEAVIKGEAVLEQRNIV